jgi:selenocysteine lyase/cysteine desulfurase
METIYANNAGTSWPKSPGVVEAASAVLAAPPFASQHVLADARAELSRVLGIAEPERILLTGSCTAALSLAIGDFPLQAGDVVLTSALEHHALLRPLQQLELTRGIVVEVSPYTPGQPFDLAFAERLLGTGRVRLIAVSGASNVTGEVLPIAALGQLARAAGVPLLLDAAQTMGVVPIDLRTLPVDMLVFAAHKGPLAPHGLGGLWVAPHVSLQSPAALCEIEPGSKAGPPRCATFPGDCDVGSVNLAAVAGFVAALRWRAQKDVFRNARALSECLRGALREQPGCHVFGGDHVDYTAAVSLRIDNLPLAQAEAFFAERGIIVRAGQHCAPSALRAIGAPEGTLRISFGPFNRDSDVDAIVTTVAEAAGRRK